MAYNPNFRGSNAKASSRQTITSYQNGTVGTLTQATPVSVNSSGQLVNVDPSNEASVQSLVGLMVADTPSSANGQVIDNGRLENIVTSFSIRDVLYVNKLGNLTNVKPDIGIGGFMVGDFVVLVGVVVKNEFNALQKDIKLMLSVIGEL